MHRGSSSLLTLQVVAGAGEQHDYRSYVGPADQYDLIGAAQFSLLYSLGLRDHHRLLDIGCGSLRAGRMLISYLKPGGYTGVEPNQWLIDEAISRELGADILAVKRPTFDTTDDLSLDHLGSFDFVLAQGVATNTGPSMLPQLLRAIGHTVGPTGLAAVTFIHPGTGDDNAIEVSIDDHDAPAWRYPDCYSYTRSAITNALAAAGLHGRAIGWYQPRHQWWLMSRTATGLPPEAFLAMWAGPTLADGYDRAGNHQSRRHSFQDALSIASGRTCLPQSDRVYDGLSAQSRAESPEVGRSAGYRPVTRRAGTPCSTISTGRGTAS